MFLTLLKKECSCYLKSVTYFIYLAAIVLFYFSQMGEIETVEKPRPGYEDYGTCRTTDKDLIMQGALEDLVWEYARGEYAAYPFGFYKSIRLNGSEQEKVKNMLLDMTSMSEKQLEEFCFGDDEAASAKIYSALKPRTGLSWKEFSARMEQLDDMLGGGSKYSKDHLKSTKVPQTYEQALEAYGSLSKDDKVTNAYARLFCDYLGIILSILPVFLAVTRVLKDRKAQADQVIFMAKANSTKIIGARFLAAVLVTVIPVLLLGCMSLMQAVYLAKGMHSEYDLFAYVKYTGFWLLPCILVSLSTGFFLTELTDSAIAVFVQGTWWFASLFSAEDLVGSVGWNLIPRFNTVGEFRVYELIREQLVKNRLCYTGIAFILVLGTIVLYNRKRKGEFVGAGTKLRNRKNKLEV